METRYANSRPCNSGLLLIQPPTRHFLPGPPNEHQNVSLPVSGVDSHPSASDHYRSTCKDWRSLGCPKNLNYSETDQ